MRSEMLNLFGITIEDSNYENALLSLKNRLPGGGNFFIVFLEGNLFSLLKNREIANTISEAEFIFPDGIAVCLDLKIRYNKRIERVSGPTFLLKCVEYGQKLGWRHFFYGGAEGVADKLVKKLKSMYPDMIVSGVYSPPFRKLTQEEEKEVKCLVENSNTDFLWVGLGGPKQEYWMLEHLNKIEVPVMLGVGAAFDFHAGVRPWAPKIVRKMGLEWLYRALTGGRRIFFRNIRCVSSVIVILISDFFKYKILGKS